MDLGDLLRAVRRGWWVVLGGVLLGLAVAGAMTARATPLYASSVDVVVSTTVPPDADLTASDIDAVAMGELYAQRRTESFVRALRSEHLAGLVADDLGLGAAEVAGRITASVAPGTVVLEVTVTDSSASRAQAIAGALMSRFADWVATAEAPVEPVRAGAEVATVVAAPMGTERVSPDPELALGLGGSLGLLLGLGLAVLADPRRRRITGDEEVLRLTGAPLLAAVPEDAGAEAFRALRANLVLGDATGTGTVVVTGVARGDGATTVTRGLAGALAQAGRRVVVVEGDPAAADLGRGLGDVLAGRVPLAAVVRSERDEGWAVLTAGTVPTGPEGVLGAPGARAALDALRGSHDHVLVTAPPLRSAGDAAVLGRLGAGLVLVARYDRTRPARLADAADAVAEAGGRLLGVVLTHVPSSAGVVRSRGHRYRADEDRGGAVAVRRAVLSTRSGGRAHV